MLLSVAVIPPGLQAQCLGGGCTLGTNQYPSGTFSTTSSSFVTVSTAIYAGEHQRYAVTLGATYEWSLCPADGGSASYDAQLTLYTDAGTILCYADDICGDDPKISWTATFTGFVKTQVNQYNCNTNSISTTLRWRQSAPSPCVAINIPSAPVSGQSLVCAAGNYLNATNVPASCGGASNSYKGGNEALYTFTPSSSGVYTISISGQTWTAIYVYSGSCPAYGGTCVGSVGNSASSKSLNVSMTAGVQYWIWFDTYPSPTSPCPGTFSLNLSAPANDNCSAATSVSPGTISANTVGATGSDLSSCGSGDTEDVWYTATNSSTVPRRITVTTSGSSFDPVLSVFGGTCSGLVELGCNDDYSGTESQVVVDCIEPGQQFYIRLAGYSGGEGTTTLTFASTPDPVAPSITCPSNITVNADAGFCDAYVNYILPWADSSGAGNYTGGGILYNPISGSGTSVSLSDDAVSGAIPIGFSFPFYGTNYTNVYISSNGFLTFNGSSGNGCCSGQVIPDAADPNNLIAFAWEDLNPSLGGTIQYFTTGSAPNRIFVVNFNSIQHHPGGNPVTAQVQLKEGIGIIEIHTTSMPSDGGNHTMGIENAAGTAATYVIGRLGQSWSTSNEGIQIIPPNQTSDNCEGAYSQLISGNGFSAYFDLGTTTETYRITDAAGNQSTCSFTVTVVDNQAPFVNVCPSNITTTSDQPGCGGKVVSYTQQFGDNCHGYVAGSMISGLASGSVFPIGTTAVSWQFDDGNGNPPATCAFNVTVNPPTALSTELNLTNGCGTCTVTDGETRILYDQTGKYLMTLTDDLALPSALGSTTGCNLSASATAPDENGDPVPVLTRFWRVTPTVNGPADVTVRFTNAEYDAMRTHPSATGIYAISSFDDLCFTRYPNGTSPGFPSATGQVVPVISVTDNGDGTISAVLDMAGFSDIYCHACNPFAGPLPVELIAFYGEQVGAVNQLSWHTASELNVSHFELERAPDAWRFTTIGQVEATGTGSERSIYQFADRDFPSGGNYYRLRTVDHDGSSQQSQVIYLGDETTAVLPEIRLYPNPAQDQLTVVWSSGSVPVSGFAVLDVLGRIRQQLNAAQDGGPHQLEIDLHDLPDGLYYLQTEVQPAGRQLQPFLIVRP